MLYLQANKSNLHKCTNEKRSRGDHQSSQSEVQFELIRSVRIRESVTVTLDHF